MARRNKASIVLLVLLLGRPAVAAAQVFPERDWLAASPESQGMSSKALAAAADYAQKHGGLSGCVVRHGYLIHEWGDPRKLADIKSATKGSIGATLLGLAVDDGLLKLDDLAQKHYPKIGTEEPEDRTKGWLERITVRHLATMTAGFDDGRPPLLVYEPGKKGIYSNDTSNMLAELLTLKFGEDLRDVFRRRVMDSIGAPASEWAWRENAFRPKSIDDVKSREFASGITITHRTLARIGYLYLRDGEWNGRRILSKEFIREATRPTDLPSFVPYYAFYWGSNAKGTYADMPKDAYWALGLGDSFVVVCPSLDVVAVRLGVGSNKSRLPGDDDDTNWGKRVEGFFKIVAQAAGDPYPQSPVIKGVTWAPKAEIVRQAKGSDNWPMTWGDDDRLYTAYGDGNGFDPKVPEKLSLGLAWLEGSPRDFSGTNLRSPTAEQKGDGKAGKKASGMLMVEGVLHVWVRNAGNSQLAWSGDHGKTWTWSDWKFTTSFGCPTFLNFGRDYAGARDEYVYVYSPDSNSAYEAADRTVLARVPKRRIRDRDAYEFFCQLDGRGEPVWTKDIGQRGAVFAYKGRCYRSTVTYHAALRRYLLVQVRADIDGRPADPRFEGGFGIYDAPEPWGPWTTAFFTEKWDVGPGETAGFPTKWMSSDGATAHLVFSGDDCFSVRRVQFAIDRTSVNAK
ncbi:MAG: serine hydrolase [Planctomycetia bacterium]|nr:serine hydrolase [Planctomycetia bacterium]